MAAANIELVAVSTPDQPIDLSDTVRTDEVQTILPPNYIRVRKEIDNLGNLAEGWDSYGARKISKEARTNAVLFTTMLATHSDEPVPVPVVGPSVEGGVVLRWEFADLEVMVKLLSNGGEYYVAKREADELLMEGEVGRFEALVERLKKFLIR